MEKALLMRDRDAGLGAGGGIHGDDKDDDARMLWRMPKPTHARLQQQPHTEPEQPQEPEDDDDHSIEHRHKAHRLVTTADATAVLSPSPPTVASLHVLCVQPAASRLKPSAHTVGNRTSASEHITFLPLPSEIRSAPARHSVYAAVQSRTRNSLSDNSPRSSSEWQSAHSRLLPSVSPPQPPPIRAARTFWQPVSSTTYGATTTATTSSASASGSISSYSSDGRARRHSILRFGSARRPVSDRGGMKKSASVEFKLHEEGSRLKHSVSDARSYNSVGVGRDAPRRLTEEEKEELYRVRPDLEIGPSPFFQEQMAELQRRNQQRVLFAMFGGLVSIVLLLVFYALLAQG